MSADGMILAAGVHSGDVFLSTDAGQTWSPLNLGSLRQPAVALSADGLRLVVAHPRNDGTLSTYDLSHVHDGTLLSKGADGFSLGLRGDKLAWRRPGSDTPLLSAANVPGCRWTHVAATAHTLPDGRHRTRLYVNDVLSAEEVSTNAFAANGEPVTLGAASGGFVGTLDEVRVWTTARDRLALKQDSLGGIEPGASGLALWFRCENDEPFAVGTLTDSSGWGSDGVCAVGLDSSSGVAATLEGRDYTGLSASLYRQNDRTLPGYNPNEEHALLQGGAAYGLRDDLNVVDDGTLSTYTSDPFVLVAYTDPTTTRPAMDVYQVVLTNALYGFERLVEAGSQLQAPLPLRLMQPTYCPNNTIVGPHFRDRTGRDWAHQAGNDGGDTNLVLRFWYPMQPSFDFPSLAAQPPALTQIPWCVSASGGQPADWTYTASWPEEVPRLYVGDTLTTAKNGLPAIRGQLSAKVLYQQSLASNGQESVVLIDPTVARKVALLADDVTSMQTQHDPNTGRTLFKDLPPALRSRLTYDPTAAIASRLQLAGSFVERTDGNNYLQLNVLTPEESASLLDSTRIRGVNAAWSNAVNALAANEVVRITDDATPFDSLALSTCGRGAGYVTVAFNDSTNRSLVASSEVVGLKVLRVEPELYCGQLDIPASDNPLDKLLTVRYTADFAGNPERYTFQWEYAEPENGLAPATDSAAWAPLICTNGHLAHVIGDAGVFGLSDHYLRCRYRADEPAVQSVVGTAYNAFTDPVLQEGWIKRVLKAINPFDQRIRDYVNYAINTELSMVQQAGPPYSGDVPLNMDAINGTGLIPIYRTILEQARDLSIDADLDGGQNVSAALMMAAGRLSDLYMVLGNEAYSDALDPTYGLESDDPEYGADATSLFAFRNQVPSLLDEELALLRGRDDRLNPPVDNYPLYNRLPWNFTADISGGQVAYVLNYGIRDVNLDGVIDAEDAQALYPQGHGDAWGHYLSAVKGYYTLLRHDSFSWKPQAEGILAGDTEITVSFLHEKKFALAAVAKAKAGEEITARTFREAWDGDPQRPWFVQRDSDVQRAWGVGEWACRASMGAYFDWLAVNNLLPATNTSAASSGIQIITRATVPELASLTYSAAHLQTLADNADAGLNPLGAAPGAVPFDISAAGIDEGQTHFEQIYDKAVTALLDAICVFERVQTSGRDLREQNASGELSKTVADEEAAIDRELIALYGYPYSDDIGPGKAYPQGYSGPDLLHYSYIDLQDFTTATDAERGWGRTLGISLTRYSLSGGSKTTEYTRSKDAQTIEIYTPVVTSETQTVSFYVSPDGLPGKPPTYTGQRRAEGEIQIALAEYARSIADLETSIASLQASQDAILVAYENGELQCWLDKTKLDATKYYNDANLVLKFVVAALELGITTVDEVKDFANKVADAAASAVPENVQADGGDVMSPARGIIKVTSVGGVGLPCSALKLALSAVKNTMDSAINAIDYAKEQDLLGLDLEYGAKKAFLDLQQALNSAAPIFTAVQERALAAENARMAYTKLLADGDTLQVERARLRANWAGDLSLMRYRNMAYRSSRSDALSRYEEAFDNAARYAFLAAKAYDYETGLLNSDAQHTGGRDFLNSIVRARVLGRVDPWTPAPVLGGPDDAPSLADCLARMKANWVVLKGRLNFSNPETETGRFSLRTELFRIAPEGAGSDKNWRNTLAQHWVPNLLTLPEFKRYCLPFNPQQAAEPALVIPFSTTIEFRKNWFGNELAGGDNAYDSSHFATKVRSVGVWFSNYNNAFGGGLANQPRAYLVPAGLDLMRVPSGQMGEIRAWNVVDQALPVPYPFESSSWEQSDWSALKDTLGGELFDIRKHGSLRAYHDAGEWSDGEVSVNARLVGRSVWNTRWLLIVPGGTLLSDANKGLNRLIYGTDDNTGTNGVSDVKLIFQTYSYSGT